MEFRQLGGSGFKVPVLCLGTGTFGGKNEHFRAFGTTEVKDGMAACQTNEQVGLNDGGFARETREKGKVGKRSARPAWHVRTLAK
jgi:hypothetical protein